MRKIYKYTVYSRGEISSNVCLSVKMLKLGAVKLFSPPNIQGDVINHIGSPSTFFARDNVGTRYFSSPNRQT